MKLLIEIIDIKVAFAPDGALYNHRRLQCFAQKGCKCVTCGIEGVELRKELWANGGGIHIDLYAYNKNGKQVLMTVDHIIPKSKGGQNELSNYQPMCEKCNNRKANN